jgi:hypothetical protein
LPLRDVPELAGVVSRGQLLATARSIAAAQEPCGAIPWFVGGHTDPWTHVECAMALSAVGWDERADAAYDWLRRVQRVDGSWPSRVRAGVVEDANAETNQCAYVAVGVWHHLVGHGDERFARRLWPTVRRAIDFVVGLQTGRGEIPWAYGAGGDVAEEALLSGCASTYHSLRCAVALADRMGEPKPEWELAAGRLGHVVAEHPEAFLPKERFAMDWYYPVLGGVVRGAAGAVRLGERWSAFAVPGLGARCVSDRPWVTGAETSELVLALETIGRPDEGRRLLADVQHLREGDGSYWTGLVFEDGVRWPVERSTWTAAAVVLAVDALSRTTPASGIFRAEGLPTGLYLHDPACGCEPEWLTDSLKVP